MAFPSIIPGEETLLTGLSKSAGEGLGTGLSSGLQAIANMKLQQMQQRHQQQNYGQSAGKLLELLNIAPDKAQAFGLALGGLSPQERNQFWQNPNALAALIQQQPQQQGQLQTGINAMQQQPQEIQEPESIIGPYTPYNPNIQGPEGVTAQQTQAMPQLQQLDKAKQLTEAFMSPKDKRAAQALELQQQKAEDRRQDKLKPFVDKIQNDAARWQVIRGKAEEALTLLDKAKNRFPGWLTGNIPESMSSWFIRDPDVRRYQSLVLEMIPLLAAEGDDKRITNMKLRLTQLAKSNVSQPVNTQASIMNGIIDQSNDKKAVNEYLLSTMDQETGNFPHNISSRVSEFRGAQEDPLKYPRYYKHNTIIDDNGKLFMNINGKRWQQLKG